MVLGLQTHEEIRTGGLTLLVTQKKKKKKDRVLGMISPSGFLLSIKQSLSCVWVLRPDAWENRHSDVIISVGQNHDTPWPPRIICVKTSVL